MAIPRSEPYLWASWLTRLLAGEAHCDWAAWFRAHFQYEKQQQGFDRDKWIARHAEAVRVRAESLRSAGYSVYVEDDNAFNLVGRIATLGGKPDIVAVRGAEAVVVDCKTGARKGADRVQVLIYMLAAPRAHRACKGLEVWGELNYGDSSVSVDPEEVNDEFRRRLGEAVERAAASSPPARSPSFRECSFCDITPLDCPERLDAAPEQLGDAQDLF